ncbi:hypothetical protein JZ751_019541 [Albula glossodonta]|uniref:Sorting nexin protein WASP-binding domain-containing protein n=1 Tax=Albula glossodonta TaxID=121402 RepID=A0A8T2MT79_9TELE|nr:hypothetical protein JZ751_019541 [Albula glossodonta]
MSDEGKMEQEKADGVRRRCRTVGFALQAEMNHFHRRREVNFREMMQAYLRQQITFYQHVGQQLERYPLLPVHYPLIPTQCTLPPNSFTMHTTL